MRIIKYVNVFVTEQCNLNCAYCYENNKSKKIADANYVIHFLENELNAEDRFNYLEIEFFGGEPLMNFPLIKTVVEHLQCKTFKKEFHFHITTNGTLVHGTIEEWLKSHSSTVSCGLSLDGDKYSQDINRSKSFDLINLDFFSKQYSKQKIKMTISLKTLGHLYENVAFCHKKGFQVSCNLAYGIDWSNPDNCHLLNEQMDLLIKFYLENPSIEPCSLLEGGLHLGDPNSQYIRRFCGVTSQSMISLSCEGKKYFCQFLVPTSNKSMRELKPIPDSIPKTCLEHKCQTCPIVNICPTCYSSNLINNGNPFIKDDGFCELQKILAKKKAEYLAMNWKNGTLKLDKLKEKELLSNILIINNI